jgi:hypothetical protein
MGCRGFTVATIGGVVVQTVVCPPARAGQSRDHHEPGGRHRLVHPGRSPMPRPHGPRSPGGRPQCAGHERSGRCPGSAIPTCRAAPGAGWLITRPVVIHRGPSPRARRTRGPSRTKQWTPPSSTTGTSAHRAACRPRHDAPGPPPWLPPVHHGIVVRSVPVLVADRKLGHRGVPPLVANHGASLSRTGGCISNSWTQRQRESL